MTRYIMVFSLIAAAAFGQTYVRPSKGASLFPLGTTGIALAASPGLSIRSSPAYDWTAFDTMRVRIYTTGGGYNSSGRRCTDVSMQYSVSELNNAVYLRLTSTSAGWVLSVWDAPSSAGPYNLTGGTNASTSLSSFAGCTIILQVTPIPFPVVASNAAAAFSIPDGGITVTVNVSNVATLPYTCGTSSVHSSYTMDGGAQVVGTLYNTLSDGGTGTPTSAYIVVCNSVENTSTANIRCRDDGVAPILDGGAPGTVLSVGQCVSFTSNTSVTAPLWCIGTSNWVSTYECAP